MAGPCCLGGRGSRRHTGRFSTAVVSLLPGLVLILLPKCPLCLAAWLAVVTGAGWSAAGAVWVRGMIVVLSVAAAAVVAALSVRRRAFGVRRLRRQ